MQHLEDGSQRLREKLSKFDRISDTVFKESYIKEAKADVEHFGNELLQRGQSLLREVRGGQHTFDDALDWLLHYGEPWVLWQRVFRKETRSRAKAVNDANIKAGFDALCWGEDRWDEGLRLLLFADDPQQVLARLAQYRSVKVIELLGQLDSSNGVDFEQWSQAKETLLLICAPDQWDAIQAQIWLPPPEPADKPQPPPLPVAANILRWFWVGMGALVLLAILAWGGWVMVSQARVAPTITQSVTAFSPQPLTVNSPGPSSVQPSVGAPTSEVATGPKATTSSQPSISTTIPAESTLQLAPTAQPTEQPVSTATIPVSPTEAPAPTAEVGTCAKVTPAELHVRSGPSPNDTSITILSKGDSVVFFGEKTGWVRVVVIGGIEGWVNSNYISIDQGNNQNCIS